MQTGHTFTFGLFSFGSFKEAQNIFVLVFSSTCISKPIVGSYFIKFIGVPRIELGLHAPHACVLPIYYTPIYKLYYGIFSAIIPLKKSFYNPISIFFLLFLAKLAKRWASSRALNKIFFDASANSWKDFFVPSGKISLSFCSFDMPSIGVLISLSRKTLETAKTCGRPPSMTIKSGAGHSLCRNLLSVVSLSAARSSFAGADFILNSLYSFLFSSPPEKTAIAP